MPGELELLVSYWLRTKSVMMMMDWTSVSQAQLNAVLIRDALGMTSVHSSKKKKNPKTNSKQVPKPRTYLTMSFRCLVNGSCLKWCDFHTPATVYGRPQSNSRDARTGECSGTAHSAFLELGSRGLRRCYSLWIGKRRASVANRSVERHSKTRHRRLGIL